MHPYSRHRSLLATAALLLAAAACSDRPTEPRAPARPHALFDERGDQLVVVGTTVRGVAALEIELRPADGGESRRWTFENAHPDDAEAWGPVAVAPGTTYEIGVRGVDREGRPRLEGALRLVVDAVGVPQVRAAAKVADDLPTYEGDPPEVYAGSVRLETAPRWVDDPRTGASVVAWAHDALGQRLPLDEEKLDVRLLEPSLGLLEVMLDPERWELGIELRPYPPPERIPPGQVLYVCAPGDVFCGRTFVRFDGKPTPPYRGAYRKVVGSTGMVFTCALGTGRLGGCWGDNFGYVGRAAFAQTLSNGKLVNELAWLPLTDIAAGGFHGCGIDSLGEAWCWGWNNRGQLGSGTPKDAPRAKPRLVVGGLRLTAITGGHDHTCAIDVAGDVWCWGSNEAGQLGDGTGGASGRYSIGPVRARLRTGTAVSIAAGSFHTCALTTAGAVECWGLDDVGQAGTQANVQCPSSRPWVPGTVSCTLAPEEVETDPVHFHNRDVTAISARGDYACAVVKDGRVFCWGEEADLNGWTSILPQPYQRGIFGRTYRDVAVGGHHACALLDTGAAHCWGRNNVGQLGRGTMTRFESGADLVLSPPSAWRSLGLGVNHSCGIRDDRQALYCWGHGDAFASRDQPQPVVITNF